MRIFSRLTFIALAALVLGSCQKQTDYPVTPGSGTTQPILPSPVTATLQGNVFDETGQPASGATVKVGSVTVTTDSRGYFRITGAALDKNQSVVTASKAGYFKAYRTFAATSGANQVLIKLLKRSLAGTVSGTSGGDASLSNGSKVSLPAGGVVDAATGAAYTGQVSVYAAYIDPSAQDFGSIVPGSLMADDKNGKRVLLNSYGMLAVELEGTGGQKLQIKSGSNATLTTAIPGAALASAPATIPMWYVDETTGIWKEEGSATKVGNTYVGNVPHFSIWNCDQPMNYVNLQLTLNGPNGQPLTFTALRFSRPQVTGWMSSTYAWTDSLGQVSGMVPANEQIVLEVLDQCWSTVYTQNMGPFTTNTTLPAITATIPGSSLSQVTGTLVNCSNAPVTNGYAVVVLNHMIHYASVNSAGQFSVNVLSCGGGGNIQILGIDNSTGIQSSVVTIPFTSGSSSASTISVCAQSAATYLNYTIDNGTQVSIGATDSLNYYSSPVAGTSNWNTYINGMTLPGTSSNHYISFTFSGPAAAGTYNVSNFYVDGQQNSSSSVTSTVTSWPNAFGDYIEGTFSGSYVVSGTTHTVSGSYRLRRMFQ